MKKFNSRSKNLIVSFRVLFLFILLFQVAPAFGQDIYVRTFGKKSNTPIIYLHRGPGYNCSSFEITTAKKLANAGYYVIAYDRRGEGRSADNAAFTFKQTHTDLIGIMDSLHIESANLIGHSFGGMVAITFAEKYKKRVQSIILVGAPVSLQESFKNIINSCEKIYTEKEDATNLSYLKMLKNMDTASIQYSSFCFMHAMQNGFYSPKKPTIEARTIYKLFGSNPTLVEYASKMGHKQPQGFWKNEAYTTMNLKENISLLKKSGLQIYGMYGVEDGLYSKQQIDDLTSILGTEKVLYISNCSHSVFIDQQDTFITTLNKWLK